MGNEKANELAMNAVFNNIIQFNIDSYFKQTFMDNILVEWTERRKNEKTFRMAKIIYPFLHRTKGKEFIKLSKNKF